MRKNISNSPPRGIPCLARRLFAASAISGRFQSSIRPAQQAKAASRSTSISRWRSRIPTLWRGLWMSSGIGARLSILGHDGLPADEIEILLGSRHYLLRIRVLPVCEAQAFEPNLAVRHDVHAIFSL